MGLSVAALVSQIEPRVPAEFNLLSIDANHPISPRASLDGADSLTAEYFRSR